MKTLFLLIMISTIGLLIGCHTIEGAGKDIERGGQAVSETARDVKEQM
ncbi:entericidin A/B family lipoprotein [Thioalkalicoccus limnaeus]|uniref:Entericidin A/B family lipoprotein n=1 Tax=Thioalkalicoccus limnaeus TaxID=120681 RepID=A0ABV4BHW8_9GAMM